MSAKRPAGGAPSGLERSSASAPAADTALRAVHAALGDAPAWLVGGAPRDRKLGRETVDLDIVIAGDPAPVAKTIARAAGGAACFELSDEFAGWRIVARDRAWQVDVQPLRGGSLLADLGLRDFTINAIAEPIGGEYEHGAGGEGGGRGGLGFGAHEPIDPFGGLADLGARRLRMVSERAFSDDPLRVLRLVRQALDLRFEIDPDTARAARAGAPGLDQVSGERVFMELRQIVGSPKALQGLALMDSLGIMPVVLPELSALRGTEQGGSRHPDVYGLLDRTIALQTDPASVLGDAELAEPVAALLAEPVADELTRGDALRWGALLHDVAELAERGMRAEGECLPTSVTRAVGLDGAAVTSIGHDDERGAELARGVLARLRASERLRGHVAGLVRHRQRLSFLAPAPQPLAKRVVFDYLQSTAPVEVDVTLLSVADRLVGRSSIDHSDRGTEPIAAHMALARTMIRDALAWRADGPPRPLWRGDELAAALGIPEGPTLGAVLRELAGAQYAGEVGTREEALAHARAFLEA
jgi:poly(A) polymerase